MTARDGNFGHRVLVITPPGVLTGDAQRQLTAEDTAIIAELASDPDLISAIWVIRSKAAEGDWGIDGTTYGIKEFTALARSTSFMETIFT